MFEKPNQQIHFFFCGNGCLFSWGTYVRAYFCMGTYRKRDVVAVVKMGAYIHGVLIFYGCLLSRFYGMSTNLKCLCSFVFVCSIKIFGKWLQTNRQIYTRVFAMQSC